MFISSSKNIYLKNLDADKMGGLGGNLSEIIEHGTMRSEVEIFLFSVLFGA